MFNAFAQKGNLLRTTEQVEQTTNNQIPPGGVIETDFENTRATQRRYLSLQKELKPKPDCFWLVFPWATQNTGSNHLCCVPLALTKYIVKILLKDQHLLLPSVTMPLLCNSLPFLCYICIFKVCIFFPAIIL